MNDTLPADQARFHSLDAVRAGALLAGIVLHATMAFLPGFGDLRWPIADKSTSETLGLTFFVIHIFRMSLFFIIAGFFGRLLHQRLGTRGLIRNRLRRIALPFVAAMALIMPFTIIAIVWAVKQAGAPGMQGGPPAMAGAPTIGPPIPLGHLWFLYLLLLLFALWLPVRAVLARLDANGARREAWGRAASGAVGTRLAPLMLALPVTAVLLSARWWLVWHGIPAPVAGLVPNLPALVAFGGAFLVGWVMHREQATLAALAADWLLYLVVAVSATLAAIFFAGDRLHFSLQPLGDFERTGFALAYALALWCWCFACIGAAMRFLNRPAPRWRYLADASYWMYLAHLPVVWLLQAWMLKWPLHWTVKFPLVLAITMALLLASYHWLVRSTFVGQFLNGRRLPRSAAPAISAPSISPG
jgi:glucans biosynthesis protein C